MHLQEVLKSHKLTKVMKKPNVLSCQIIVFTEYERAYSQMKMAAFIFCAGRWKSLNGLVRYHICIKTLFKHGIPTTVTMNGLISAY